MGSAGIYIQVSGGIGLYGPCHICSGRTDVWPNQYDALGGVKIDGISN